MFEQNLFKHLSQFLKGIDMKQITTHLSNYISSSATFHICLIIISLKAYSTLSFDH